jgi:hypothetical protein
VLPVPGLAIRRRILAVRHKGEAMTPPLQAFLDEVRSVARPCRRDREPHLSG